VYVVVPTRQSVIWSGYGIITLGAQGSFFQQVNVRRRGVVRMEFSIKGRLENQLKRKREASYATHCTVSRGLHDFQLMTAVRCCTFCRKNARRRRPRGVASRPSTSGSRASAEAVTSSSSVNNDWKHWVAMQGDATVVEEDVLEVGHCHWSYFQGQYS
jgi:hypothetical protein